MSCLAAWVLYGWYLAQGATQESFSAMWVVVLSLVAVPLTPLWGASAWGLLKGRAWGWWLAVVGNLLVLGLHLLVSGFDVFLVGRLFGMEPAVLVESGLLLLVPVYLLLPEPRAWCSTEP